MRLLGYSKQVLRSNSLNICTPLISVQSARTLITAITHKQLGHTSSQCGYKGVPVTFQKCSSICAISWHSKTGLRFYTSPATGDKKAQKVQGIQELISATSIAKRATRRKKPGTRGTEEVNTSKIHLNPLTLPMLRLLLSRAHKRTNPVLLVFIGKLLPSSLRCVPISQGFNNVSAFLHRFV